MQTSRRNFCKTAITAVAGLGLGSKLTMATGSRKKKVAAIVVRYGLRMHSDNIVTRMLEGYWINEEFHSPAYEVSSVYVHYVDDSDISRRLSDAYGFELSPTIADALTLGTGKLAVDGVVMISEDVYTQWTENPFFSFFSQVVDVFRKSGRSVPVFNDKALSHDWQEAQWMVRQSRELGFPLLAGSTTSVTFRRPELAFPTNTPFEDALVLATIPPAHIESLSFHALELLQCVVERRTGGESGVRAVQFIQGAAVWAAAENGVWSRELFDAAASRSFSRSVGKPEDLIPDPYALIVEYNDGFKGTVIGAAGLVRDFNFAVRVNGEVQSAAAYIPWQNSNNFGCLVRHFELMMENGEPAYPIERTLLTCGTLDFLMQSHHGGDVLMETPELAVAYQPPAVSAFFRGEGS